MNGVEKPLTLRFDGVVVIVGNYGSGKTEVSVNLAVNQSGIGQHVRIADLDLVNPYFRTREVKTPLAELGIEMILPPDKFLQADLPILSPSVAGLIRQPFGLTILDVGGDDVGATVLSSLSDSFQADSFLQANKKLHVLQVINPFRPFTETVQGCLKIKGEIEKASRMKITGFINNANLIDETTTGHINLGYDFAKQLSKETRLPVEFMTVAENLLPRIEIKQFDCPILTIKRQLVPPWAKAVSLNS
ncbi:MAG: cobalamin biosynthesis protein CbiA [Desulfobacterales bacterium]